MINKQEKIKMNEETLMKKYGKEFNYAYLVIISTAIVGFLSWVLRGRYEEYSTIYYLSTFMISASIIMLLITGVIIITFTVKDMKNMLQ